MAAVAKPTQFVEAVAKPTQSVEAVAKPTKSVAAPTKPTQSVEAPTKPTPPSNATMPTKPIQPSTSPTKNTLFPEIVPCSNIQFYDWGDSIGSLPYSLSCRLQGTLRYDSADSVNQIESGLL